MAIHRASQPQQSEDIVRQFLNNEWGVPVGVDFKASNCVPGLLDARGKEVLSEGLPVRGAEPAKPSVEARFGCRRQDIAAQFDEPEVPDDVRLIIQELHTMSQAGAAV
jgi:hypothetical protein